MQWHPVPLWEWWQDQKPIYSGLKSKLSWKNRACQGGLFHQELWKWREVVRLTFVWLIRFWRVMFAFNFMTLGHALYINLKKGWWEKAGQWITTATTHPTRQGIRFWDSRSNWLACVFVFDHQSRQWWRAFNIIALWYSRDFYATLGSYL